MSVKVIDTDEFRVKCYLRALEAFEYHFPASQIAKFARFACDLVDEGSSYPPPADGPPRGITPKQADYYALLCEELGWEYDGDGMTCAQARAAIDRAVAARDQLRLTDR
jgi:hypothetical protein